MMYSLWEYHSINFDFAKFNLLIYSIIIEKKRLTTIKILKIVKIKSIFYNFLIII